MRYIVNGSCSMNEIDENIIVVNCDDYLRKYECDREILKNIIDTIEKTNDKNEVYKLYLDEYSREEIDEFIDTLIEENIIIKVSEGCIDTINVVVVGEEKNYKSIKKVVSKRINLEYVDNICGIDLIKDNIDVIIVSPGASDYKNIIEINSVLVKLNIPFVVIRFTGESYVLGPFVFPYKSPCMECHIQQHIDLLEIGNEDNLFIEDIEQLLFSRKWDDTFESYEIESLIKVVLDDIEKIKNNKTDFELFKREIVYNKKRFTSPIIKTYQSTSKCRCCNNMNRHYIMSECADKIKIPKYDNPLYESNIKYNVGGLRSVDEEDTKKLIETTLKRLDLDIRIERDLNNPFADIVPVYHSMLDTTHKNNTPYFFTNQKSHGKGINRQQSYFSASFEMFERLNARYFGDAEVICGQYNKLIPYCADVTDIVKTIDKVESVYDVFDPDMDIDWVWGHSLVDKEAKLIPASLVYLSRNSFKGNFPPIGSSGMSAGAAKKDAILQGLFELIEHDAWMIGQANNVRLPIVEYRGLKNKKLAEIIYRIQEKGYKIVSRDYTTDIGVPVIRTWIYNPNNYNEYAFSGFGASVYPELALERSITEAVQSRASYKIEDVKEYGSRDMEDLISARDGFYSLYYFNQKDINNIGLRKDISEMKCIESSSVENTIEYLIKKIRNVNSDADVIYVDLTKKGIDIPTVKVFVTKGLQLMQEPLIVTSDRLFSFQKTMGYSDKDTEYTEMYLASYPH